MDIKEIYDIYRQQGVITTDTRQCAEGSIFLALRGATFNGNEFAVNALEAGCSYAIVEKAYAKGGDKCVAEGDMAKRLIGVDDTLQTFKDIAREHRRQFHHPVIGITGTNGKTTTKELIATVLQKKYRVLFTQGNFNNDVGVPKTLLRLDNEAYDIAVVEMGASHPGDIKTLVETAEPTCGLITNVGRAHLQGFGSFEGVKATKGELYDFLVAHEAPAFVNANDPDILEMAEERHISTMPYAEGTIAACDPYLKVQIKDGTIGQINTQLIGSYNLPNILAAVTVGRHFGVSDADIHDALEAYCPSNNRSQLTVTADNHLVVDAYNANPTSMAAAIDNFQLIATEKPKMLILGSMGELGEVSHDEHMKIVERLKLFCQQNPSATVWLVGAEFEATGHPFRQFSNVDAVKETILQQKPAGQFILIKGSNSQKLFQLPEML